MEFRGLTPRIAILGIRGIPANYGGFETCAEELSRRWAAWGCDVLVYARRYRYSSRPSTVNGVRVRYIGCLRSLGLETPSAATIAVLRLILRAREVRWVHLYDVGNAFLIPALRMFGFRVLVSVDGLEWERRSLTPARRWVYRAGAAIAARFANRVVADNVVVADWYTRHYDCKPEVIAYGARPVEPSQDAQDILSRFRLTAQGYCIFVGRLVPEKCVRELIDAFGHLSTALVLVIVGDTAPGAYRDEIRARASERVRFLGFQYGQVCEQLLASAHMYVSASMLEGTSPSLLSAMSAGVCCLVNDLAEHRASAAESVAYFRRNDSDDLVRCWQALLDDPARRAALAAAGRAHQRRLYDWDVVARRYLEVFQEMERERQQSTPI